MDSHFPLVLNVQVIARNSVNNLPLPPSLFLCEKMCKDMPAIKRILTVKQNELHC